jgi:hypothetical protein
MLMLLVPMASCRPAFCGLSEKLRIYCEDVLVLYSMFYSGFKCVYLTVFDVLW